MFFNVNRTHVCVYRKFIFFLFLSVNNTKDTILLEKLGVSLREIRISKNMSQEHLANVCDIPISQIGRIERVEINCTICTLKLIFEALQADYTTLIKNSL